MSDDRVGYVVIERNQASHQVSIAADASELFESLDEAMDAAYDLMEASRRIGRRDQYAPAAVTIEEDQ